jgi:DNA-directed RNA polymerase subunit RPC12/RpoP
MNKKIETKNRKAAFVELKEFCLFSMGERTDKGDFLEVTEWSNSEGYDIHISDVNGEKQFNITWGQMEALFKCVKSIDESFGEEEEKEGDFLSTYNGWPTPKSDNDLVPYNTICGCNPANGGSGMCGCTMGNTMVRRGGFSTTTSTNSGLVSLDEHNSNAWSTQVNMFSNEPKPNGIACPECGNELMDTNPMMTLTSHPAKKNVHCPKCEYRGYRIV